MAKKRKAKKIVPRTGIANVDAWLDYVDDYVDYLDTYVAQCLNPHAHVGPHDHMFDEDFLRRQRSIRQAAAMRKQAFRRRLSVEFATTIVGLIGCFAALAAMSGLGFTRMHPEGAILLSFFGVLLGYPVNRWATARWVQPLLDAADVVEDMARLP